MLINSGILSPGCITAIFPIDVETDEYVSTGSPRFRPALAVAVTCVHSCAEWQSVQGLSLLAKDDNNFLIKF
jgi:hypothetical protein